MALSNWDTLAVNLKGEEIDGSFTSPLGVEVSFYKNWIYVRDPVAWQDGGKFVKDTVMQISEGVIDYKDVSIHAIRGPQNGIYAFVHSGYEHDDTFRGMIGCGVYGFGDASDGVDEDGYAPWVGVRPSSREFLQNWISRKRWDSREQYVDYIRALLGEDHEVPEDLIANALQETVLSEAIAKIDLTHKKRFNQGDAYFVGAENAMTEVGKAGETILSQVIKKM
jgi:hypothetical protein